MEKDDNEAASAAAVDDSQEVFGTAPEESFPPEFSQELLTATEKDTVGTSNKDPKQHVPSTVLSSLYNTLQSELHNLGKSLTCPLCLSCYSHPVLLPCVHAYCRDCITTSLSYNKKCPTCCQPCTKRSLLPAESLSSLVVSYKQLLRALGWTPIVYSSNIHCMTQLVDSHNDLSINMEECATHLQVSKTWQKATLGQLQQQQHAAAVVAVDEEAWRQAQQGDAHSKHLMYLEEARTLEKLNKHVAPTTVDTKKMVASMALNNKSDDAVQQNIDKGMHDHMINDECTALEQDDQTDQFHGKSNINDECTALEQIDQDGQTDQCNGEGNIDNDELTCCDEVQIVHEGATDRVDAIHAPMKSKHDEPACVEHNVAVAVDDDSNSMDMNVPTPSTPVTKSHKGIALGTIVHVQSRTWPGINKPGGVGRIVQINDHHGASLTYDICYVLGGKEKQVEAVFVKMEEEQPLSSGKRRRIGEIPVSVLQALAADGFETDMRQEAERIPKKGAVERKPLTENKNSKVGNNSMPFDDSKAGARKKRIAEPTKNKKMVSPVSRKTTQKHLTSTKQRAKDLRMNRPTSTEDLTVSEQVQLPLLTNVEKCSLADEYYERRFESAKFGAVIHIVSSTLSEDDCAKLELLCNESKNLNVTVKYSDVFNPKKTNLCIIPLDNGRSNDTAISRTRTLKAMRAALAGVPIVSPDWLAQCLVTKSISRPLPTMFIRSFPSKTEALDSTLSSFGVAIQAARMQQLEIGIFAKDTNILPLSNCFVLLCGAFTVPKKSDIILLLKEAGANIMASPSSTLKQLKSLRSQVVLLCNCATSNDECGITSVLAKNVMEAKARVFVVNSSWLFDSISCGVPAPARPYEPLSPIGKELWAWCVS